jgi:hypothetical protein
MTVFLVSSSNPGISNRFWNDNSARVTRAFNASAQIDSWLGVNYNSWLVDAKEGVTASKVVDIVSNAFRWNCNDGWPVEHVVVPVDDRMASSAQARDRQVVLDWLEVHKRKTGASIKS